ELDVLERDDLPVGLASRGDVAVIDCNGRPLAQSVDQVRSFVDDPWLFGRIATIHALSDLYAARSLPQSAMVIVTLPWGAESTMRRELSQLMRGVTVELSRAGCALSGGHTAEGLETSLGFVVNGYSPGAGESGANGPRAGDCLILTKPLGTGVILAAAMRARAAGPVLDMALESMLQSNARAAGIIGDLGTSAMTDVTGFGLAGHLLTLLRSSGLSCHLWPDAVPALPGAAALHREGIHSSLQGANVRMLRSGGNMEALDAIPGWELLTDPQTSGGLLAVIPTEAVDGCLEALRRAGYDRAACIGMLAARAGREPLIACGPVPQSFRCP
ncbi:MAG: selenide, water dikinase SelD, partial [Gammaproteobacteria bacterium]|nr:selenide, water dikinase SelD [Gammaproteobacteria bacterium]